MKRDTAYLVIVGLVLVAYVVWMFKTAADCRHRGGIPVFLPTGTECAARLR